LLLGNARAFDQFGAAHAARLARIIEAGLLLPGFRFACHRTMVTDSVKNIQAHVTDRATWSATRGT
jgi:hypothetical protein